MATCQLSPVIEQLRSTLMRDGASLTDGQLLSRFIECEDETAFEALVRRHGPMVLGVSRRLLRNHHDAEDAFQATFLVLVRRAACIAPPEKLANWLYGVAYRTALKAKATKTKRTVYERPMMAEPETQVPQGPWDELLPLLDQELSRMPDKYRLPIVLCDLEGKSIKEAARNLDWPQGTLAGRLARARKLLAKRFARHGLVLSVGTLAAIFSRQVASAGLPARIICSTVQAACLGAAGSPAAGLISVNVAALTKGVLKSMWLSKIKTAMALFLTLGAIGLGGGALSYALMAGEESKGKQESSPTASKPVDDDMSKKKTAQTDVEKLQGTWKLVRLEAFGKVFGPDKMTEVGDLVIDGNHVRSYQPYSVVPKQCVLTAVASNGGTYTTFHRRWHGTFELDAGRNPKRIRIIDTDEGLERLQKFDGIYSLDGDALTICLSYDGSGTVIPLEFKTEEYSWIFCYTFRWEKPAVAPKTQEQFHAGRFRSVRGFPLRTPDQETAETDMEKLQGDWELMQLESKGQQIHGARFAEVGNLTIEGDHLFGVHREPSESSWSGIFELDPSKKPKRLTIFNQGFELQGIYSVDQRELRICLNDDGTDKTVPSEFKTKPGSPFTFATFRRMKVEQSWRINQLSSSLSPMQKNFKQYQVDCTLVKVDPKGKDLGKDGNGKVLSQPSLLLREGAEESLHSGGERLGYGDDPHTSLEFGVFARLKVISQNDGRVLLQAQLEEVDIDQTGKCPQARGRFVRIVARPKLGESVKLVEKDERGEPQHWLRIRVVKEETVDVTTRSAEPAQQGK
jgi:RNA polymerase sigma-70 factor (ECF subfamily)